MPIDTGIKLLDAIINNPIQAMALFAILYFGHKFFYSRDGYLAEERHHLKFELNWQLEKLSDWIIRTLERNERWAEKITKRQWLNYSILIMSIIFIPMILYNILFSERNLSSDFLLTALVMEYVGLILFTYYKYKKQKVKNNIRV